MRAVKSILRWFLGLEAVARHAVTAFSTVAQIAALIFWSRLAYAQHLLHHHGLSWIVLIAAACIITTVIHECGHAILAWCFEMKLLSFRAGPFQWASREGKWAFKFHAAGLITQGGSISATPTRPDQPAWEFILMIAAGPGANLLIGAAAVWAVIHDRWGTYQQTWEFIAYTGAFCLIGAALNLIPFLSEEGSYSDGARILQILTRSPLLVASPALAPASDAVATPESLSVVPPAFAPVPCVAAAPEPAPTPLAATPPFAEPGPDLPQVVAVVSAPSPPPPVPARPTVTPGTIRPVDAVTLAVAKVVPDSAEPGPEPVQAELAVIPVEAAPSGPAPDTDDLLAARLASFLARSTPSPAATTPIAAMAPNPLAGSSFTPDLSPAESSSTGRIASVTRILASALDTTPPPPAIRLPAASESATVSAPTAPTGPKAPAVPAAFARRSRPAPLPNSGSPAIDEILAEAATALDDPPPDASIEVEDPVLAAPYASAIMPLTTSPASTTASETAPLGPTFSEGWPSRPTFMPPASAPSESQIPAPVVSAQAPAPVVFAPTPRLLTSADDQAIEESPVPPPQPETPRFDAFSFLRAAAIENISANPG